MNVEHIVWVIAPSPSQPYLSQIHTLLAYSNPSHAQQALSELRSSGLPARLFRGSLKILEEIPDPKGGAR